MKHTDEGGGPVQSGAPAASAAGLFPAALPLEERLAAAEQVCLMVGWTAAQSGERGKALHELWVAWVALYEAAGGTLEPRHHPELSDERIRELAAQRDATVARTLGRIGAL
jgi:hypothetical protein